MLAMRLGPVFIAGLMLLVGCTRGAILADGEPGADSRADAGPPLPRPARLDLLVVVTVGHDSVSVYDRLTAAAMSLVHQLIEPDDGRPVRDLHLGVVTSKVDMPYYCASKPDTVRNDGTLLVPRVVGVKPWPGYPSGFPWPPSWEFITYDVLKQAPELAGTYVGGAADATTVAEGECSVTQFLESAALAVDGRNAGFVRPDSLLVVLVLADREDCSTKDAAQWSETTGWKNEFYDPNARCYYPPAGLLHPVKHYVDELLEHHPAGRTIVGLVAKGGTPTFVQYYGNGKYAWPACYFGTCMIMPSLRFPAFVQAVAARGSPRLEAQMIDACVVRTGDAQATAMAVAPLARRILQVVAR